jgi:hypothetical protein
MHVVASRLVQFGARPRDLNTKSKLRIEMLAEVGARESSRSCTSYVKLSDSVEGFFREFN